MKRKFILFNKILLGILLFGQMSCVDIDLSNVSKDVQINQSLVMPIGEDSLSVEDILNKLALPDQIVTDVDTINFVTELNEEYKFQDINLLDNPVTTDLPFTIAPIPRVLANDKIPIVGTVTEISFGLDPNSTTKRVDRIDFASLTFGIKISKTNLFVYNTTTPITPSDLRIVMTFPKMYKKNTTTPIDPITVLLTSFDQFSDTTLTNFYMDTKGSTGTPVDVKLYAGGRDITVAASATLGLSVVVSDIKNIVAYGQFRLTSQVPTILKLPLDVLSAIPSGLLFADPKVKITLKSDIGTYLSFNIESIKAFSKDHLTVKQGYFNGSPSIVEPLKIKPETPYTFITKQLHTIDKDYGTLDQLFDTSLDTLEYKFALVTDDALNNSSPTASYITPGMSISANVKIEVPLRFKKGSNISVSDTIKNLDIPFGDVEDAILYLTVTNALPVKATFSVKFLNANNGIITSSLNNSTYVINSGVVNGLGIATNPTVSPINIQLTKAQANEIKDAKSMIYTLALAGKTDNDPINITKKNYIKVKLGAYVKGGITTTIGSNN